MSDLDVQNINSKTGNAAIAIADAGDVTISSAIKIGLWEIKLDTNDLRFVYDGTDVAKITTAGEIIALDDVTGFGAP
jgi:hypothetical protein